MSYYDDYDSDDYYSYNSKVDESKIKKDFLNYADSKSKKIKVEGMEKMGTTLGIDIYTDIFITYFFYKCKCKSMEEVTEQEYVTGLKSFKENTLAEVKKKIIKIREKLLDCSSPDFSNFYKFLFTFNVEKKTKLIPIEVVEVYFNQLFKDQFAIVTSFLKFIMEVQKLKGLNKDQWECFLDFLLNQGSTFPSTYNCDEYYPLLFDDFFKWYLEKEQK